MSRLVFGQHVAVEWHKRDRYGRIAGKVLVKGQDTNLERKRVVDYLRNVAGATIVAAYSPRAKPNAPVSVPIGWEELNKDDLRFDHFNIAKLARGLKQLKADPWRDYENAEQRLSSEKRKRVGQFN
jgi:DNA primase